MPKIFKKELNLKNKFKNIFKKIFKYVKYIIFITFCILIVCIIYKIKNKYLLQQNIEEILEENVIDQEKNVELIKDTLDNFEEKVKLKEEFFAGKIENFENLILDLQEKVNTLQNNISNLENINPANNEKNLQIVILLYKIQDVVCRGGDFSKYFEYLINVTNNKKFILENILKLEKYKNQKTQRYLKDTFYEEYLVLLSSKDNKNKLKTFFDDNIKIRKISNFDKNSDKINIDISNIEESINIFSYEKAIKIIIDNNYSQYFSNTLGILNEKNEAIIIINKILDFIYKI